MINIGAVIDDRYKIAMEIDRGGMSIVYLAHDKRLNKNVAIKEILKAEERKSAQVISDKELLVLLKKECDLLVALDHYNIPKISNVIEVEGHIFVVMDFIEGKTLHKKQQEEQRCSPKDVIEWGIQLSDILNYLHTYKNGTIIYRDMKPQNIMVTPEGKIKLIDFGTAISETMEDNGEQKKTKNFGTKAYAAPEQLNKGKIDQRTDIYSLGVVLYKLVTGVQFTDNRKLKPIREIDPTLPEGLEYILSKCLKENPNERYQSAADMLEDFKNINKLTKDYRKKIIKQMSLFLISFTLFIVSSCTTLYGYDGLRNVKLDNYKSMMNEANFYRVEENYARSIEALNKVITEVDNKLPEAYINLIDTYAAMGDVDGGLSVVESYINDKYGNVHKNDEVLFKVAMTYLDNKNYPLSLKYFRQVDSKRIPDAKYYSIISNSMSSMNVDYVEFQEELIEFEKYVDNLPNNSKKLDNYNSLANIYSSYKGQISNSNDKIIEILDKADRTLQNIEDGELALKYETDFCQKLAQAYHSKGSNSNDKELAQSNFSKAINLYNELLELEVKNSEDICIKIGEIYTETKEYSVAIEQFTTVVNKYENSIKGYSKLINVLLDVEQSKESGQDYSQALKYYENASRITGIDGDEDFKKLKRRLINLQLI